MHSNVISEVPAFVWWFLIGLITCFMLGYCCRTEQVDRKGPRYSLQRIDLALMASAGFGLWTATTCLRYFITIPKFFLWKFLLFGATIGAIIVLTVIFMMVVYAASKIPVDETDENGRRHHRHNHHRVVR